MADGAVAGEQLVAADDRPDELQASFLNARADTIDGGTSEIQKTIPVERALAVPRS